MRSLNEIDTMLQKASKGAGLPVGLAEDIARAGAWLAARGHDGVRAVLTAIRGGISLPVPLLPLKDRGIVVFKGACIAVCGPSVIDILTGDGSTDEVRLINVDSPLLIIGLAGVASQNYGLEMTIGFGNGSKASLSSGNLVLSGSMPAAGTDVLITCRKLGYTTPKARIEGRGVVVDEEIWREVKALAARTYVPSSEASRARGAGAGMVDND